MLSIRKRLLIAGTVLVTVAGLAGCFPVSPGSAGPAPAVSSATGTPAAPGGPIPTATPPAVATSRTDTATANPTAVTTEIPAPVAGTPATTVTPSWTAAPLPQETPTSVQEPGPMSGTPTLEPSLNVYVNPAKADLSARTGVPVDQIQVVSVESVTWPDGSLGCPQPGMMYTQVMVDGLRIRLEANGQVYEYHSGGPRGPFLCEHPAD